MSPRLLRVLLALAVLLPLAGCSAAGSLDMTAVDDAALANEASRSLPPPEAGAERSVVRRAVEEGSATANGTGPPILVDGELSASDAKPFAVDGAYYDLSVEPVDNHTEVAVNLEIDYNGSTEGQAVAYADLSPADRQLVDDLLPQEHEGRSEGYDMGAVRRYTRAEVEDSVLLAGDYAAIRFEGERYPIAVDRRDVTVTTYRYTAEQVAPDAETYAESLRENHLFTLSGLSADERTVVDEAVNTSYYAESNDDEAFRAVMERFFAENAVTRDEYHGEWVVRYRGEVYWAELDYSGFSMDDEGQ